MSAQMSCSMPYRVALVGSTAVTAAPGSTVAIEARLADASDQPVQGRQVSFEVEDFVGRSVGTVEPPTPSTNANGIASAEWTLGDWLGQRHAPVTASFEGIVAEGQFTATTRADATAVSVGGLLFPLGCVTTDAGASHCWSLGARGNDSPFFDDGPGAPVETGETFTSLTAGGAHACALTASGTAWCWGDGSRGQLGYGSVLDRETPVRVQGNLTFKQIAIGGESTCALEVSGAAWCWGDATGGKLGDGTQVNIFEASPVPVVGSHSFTALSVGDQHACGLDVAGAAWCWGGGAYPFLLGTGEEGTSSTPVKVTGGHVFKEISAGWIHTCALTVEGEVFCWGLGGSGQFGKGEEEELETLSPVKAQGGPYTSVTVGQGFTCMLNDGGETLCTGTGRFGRLGNGDDLNRSTPTRVLGGHQFSQVVSAAHFACGLTVEGEVYCWGRNNLGQLGDGTTVDRFEPVQTLYLGPA